jgi:hypothetical protein
LIVYRKGPGLRIKRAPAPEPPWWAATTIAPYGGRRALPVAVDYVDLRATGGERLEVIVAENVTDQLERAQWRFEPPVLVDCAETAETVFKRGQEALQVLEQRGLPAMALTSPLGTIPDRAGMTVLAAWPLDFERLRALAAALRSRPWGLAVPIIFPVTTDLAALAQLQDIAAEHGAHFLAAVAVEVDAPARQALAQALTRPDDEETFGQLFHSDLEPLITATERHVGALAAEAKMADFIAPPRWEERTNWNAAVLLTLTATRMLAMASDIELAGTIARSARLVASLEKPLERIAEAASLGIVEGLDEASADILSDWLAGARSPFVERVNREWRLRRDAGMPTDAASGDG